MAIHIRVVEQQWQYIKRVVEQQWQYIKRVEESMKNVEKQMYKISRSNKFEEKKQKKRKIT